MDDKPEYDEKQELRPPWDWVVLIVLSAALMGYGWMIYLLVQDAARRWDFGQLPDAPAESIYSSEQPRRPTQRQIQALPEAVPLQPAPGRGKDGGER